MLVKRPISVLIPTYNRPNGLAEALESIARQTELPEEIIVINDAGNSVREVVALYAELNIKLVELPSNQGHLKVRNMAIALSTQPWVIPLDDDDWFLPTHIASLWKQTDEADLVFSDAEIVDFRITDNTRIPIGRRLFAYEWDDALLRKFNTIVPSGMLYRRRLHEQLGQFDEQVFNYWDWDWCLRVAKVGKIVRVPKATTLYAFAAGGDNQSAQLSEKRKQYFHYFCEKHQLGELPMMNFAKMLEQPELKACESESEQLWDGKPLHTRLSSRP